MERLKSYAEYIGVIIIVFLVNLLTLQSPLYNLCTEDNSIFFIIGREITKGSVLYKDITDQKGAYIFFIYAIAALISETTQVGVYLIKSTLMSVAICYMYSAIKDKTNTAGRVLIVIVSTLALEFVPVVLWGGYCEDFILILYTISLTAIYKHSDEKYSNWKIMILHAILGAVVLNMKPNYVLFYVPIALGMIITTLRNKNYKTFRNNVLAGISGITIGCTPVLAYCIINNCFNEMINELFNNNSINTYGSYNISITLEFIYNNLWALVMIVISSIIVYKFKKNMFIMYISICVLTLISALMSGRNYVHYLEPLLVFLIPFVVFIIIQATKCKLNKFCTIMLYFLTFIIIAVQCVTLNAIMDLNNEKVYIIISTLYKNEYSNCRSIVHFGYSGVIYYGTDAVVTKHFSLPCMQYDKYNESILYNEELIKKDNPDMIIFEVGYCKSLKLQLSDSTKDIINSKYTKLNISDTGLSDNTALFYIRNDLVDKEE